MAEPFVQVAPDGVGKKIDAQGIVDTASGDVVYRQTVVVGDAIDLSAVQSVKPGGVAASPSDGAVVVVVRDALPLAAGAATSAKQDAVIAAIGSPLQAGGSIGNTEFGATQSGAWAVSISGTPEVTLSGTTAVSAAALPLPGNAAQETGGNLATIAAHLTPSAAGVSDVAALPVQGVVNGVPVAVAIEGDPAGDWAGVNILEEVARDGSGVGFNVKVLNFPKFDANGAQVISDAPAPISIGPLPVGGVAIIDTTGYCSLDITTQALAGNVTASNDGITWEALTGLGVAIGAYVTAVAAAKNYHFPAVARYIKITATAAGSATAYLRSQPWQGEYTTVQGVNAAQVAGTATVTAGVAGMVAVGGNIAPGTARTANPVPIGGADVSNLTRVLLTDAAGRAAANGFGLDAQSMARAIGAIPATPFSVPALATHDVSSSDGATLAELMRLILTELVIANHQRHEMINGAGATTPPDALRNDQTLFN